MKKIASVFFLSFFAPYAMADSAYDAVISGKECQEDTNQSLSCSYKVGESLFIEIAGIGSPDAGIAFLKSDYDGDYYGNYGLLHGCVIVTRTEQLDFAFVSPKNGKVYKTWQECRNSM